METALVPSPGELFFHFWRNYAAREKGAAKGRVAAEEERVEERYMSPSTGYIATETRTTPSLSPLRDLLPSFSR